ncbi:MAG TPA: hypothetical protein VKR42_03190, partial [Ktedonobacteraceae bacterium]|nr:hypothetical protein [Ktedonobacteraceae bacterium]
MSDQWDTEKAIHLLPSLWRHTLLTCSPANGSIPESAVQARVLSELSQALAQARRWEQAQQVIDSISHSFWQARALSALGQALAQAQRWEQARQVIDSISESDGQTWPLSQ